MVVRALTRSVAFATVQTLPTHWARAGPAASSRARPSSRAAAPLRHHPALQRDALRDPPGILPLSPHHVRKPDRYARPVRSRPIPRHAARRGYLPGERSILGRATPGCQPVRCAGRGPAETIETNLLARGNSPETEGA